MNNTIFKLKFTFLEFSLSIISVLVFLNYFLKDINLTIFNIFYFIMSVSYMYYLFKTSNINKNIKHLCIFNIIISIVLFLSLFVYSILFNNETLIISICSLLSLIYCHKRLSKELEEK